MNSKQYTIRNIPSNVDRYLRKKARLSNRSLNQVVIDELSERAGIPEQDVVSALDWFIGRGGMDKKAIQAIADEDKAQKEHIKKELGL